MPLRTASSSEPTKRGFTSRRRAPPSRGSVFHSTIAKPIHPSAASRRADRSTRSGRSTLTRSVLGPPPRGYSRRRRWTKAARSAPRALKRQETPCASPPGGTRSWTSGRGKHEVALDVARHGRGHEPGRIAGEHPHAVPPERARRRERLPPARVGQEHGGGGGHGRALIAGGRRWLQWRD